MLIGPRFTVLTQTAFRSPMGPEAISAEDGYVGSVLTGQSTAPPAVGAVTPNQAGMMTATAPIGLAGPAIHTAVSEAEALKDLAYDALGERGIPTRFSAESMRELERPLADLDDPSIRPLENLPWTSLDQKRTSVFEQLVAVEEMPEGKLKVRVAVSDTDAAAPKDSALDEDAYQRGTSFYTVGRDFPMFPWKLARKKTSLEPNKRRLAVVTEFIVDQEGVVSGIDCYRAAVVNHQKLSFGKVDRWMENDNFPRDDVGDQTRLQVEAAERLMTHREANELVGLPNEDGSSGVIEELVKTAGESDARFLERKGFPVLYQTIPAPARWDRIGSLARRSGHQLPKKPSIKALRGFLRAARAKDPEGYPDLSLSVEKLLGKTSYALKRPGDDFPEDFRLHEAENAPSSATTRKYIHLINQRLLKAAMADEEPPYASDELQSIADHCAQREGDAKKIGRRLIKSRQALQLLDKVGETFEGVVTGASKKGTWVKVRQHDFEGKVVHGWRGLDVGDKVKVRLEKVDVERGFIDLVTEH